MKREHVKVGRCKACDCGEEKFKPAASSVFPNPLTMHRPSNFICLNEIPDAMYEALAARERGE